MIYWQVPSTIQAEIIAMNLTEIIVRRICSFSPPTSNATATPASFIFFKRGNEVYRE